MTRLPVAPARSCSLLLLSLLVSCDSARPDPMEVQAPTADVVGIEVERAGANAIPGRYIVLLTPNGGDPDKAAADLISSHGGQLHFSYRTAVRGFAASLPDAAIQALSRNPNVAYIGEDAMAHASDVDQTSATWGLDRIDQRDLPLNTVYGYTPTGAGVTVYVLDTGIRTTHNDFGGRASVGADYIGDGWNGQDCDGHGTHVAGTIGSATYGVAKAVSLVSVRVLDCGGSGSWSGIISGIDWVTANAAHPAVANMSLGGGLNTAVNDAVAASIASGVTYVLAAGNSDEDACDYTPASTPSAITVGSTTSTDARSSFSNWGFCVDIFAPGSSITSTYNTSNTATATMSGTSMASPHVAGVAALHLQGQPAATAAAVTNAILGSASMNRLSALTAGSPNNLLYSRLTAAETVFSLNPTSLDVTFVRAAGGASTSGAFDALTGAGSEFTVQDFQAGGTGSAKGAGARSAESDRAYVATTASQAALPVHLLNTGTAARDWLATTNRAWLDVGPAGGQLGGGYSAIVSTTVTASSLALGAHSGSVTFEDAGSAYTLAMPVSVGVYEATTLTSGAALASRSGTLDSRTFYLITVPTAAPDLRISVAGGSGDLDLYVKYGAAPSLTDFDCRPYMGGNTESCTVNFPEAGTYYVMLHGFFAYSGATLTATIGGPPAAPTNAVAAATSSTSVNVTWDDQSANESKFRLLRRTRPPGGSWSGYSLVTEPGVNVESYTNTGLTGGYEYQYRLRACNVAGCSTYATAAAVTMPMIPNTPGAMGATVLSSSSIKVTWGDASTNETKFRLFRRTHNGSTWGSYVFVRNIAANTTSYTNTGLAPGTTYQYRIQACNASGCSSYRTGSSVTTINTPLTPTSITLTVLSSTSIRVNWTDASTNETKFRLFRRMRNDSGTWGSYQFVVNAAANSTMYTNTGLTSGKTYQYRISACNADGCSSYKASATATTP